jgi:hypothetical protein
MKALEFQASLSAEGTLPVPTEIATQLEHDRPIRVILLVPEGDEDEEWERLSAEEFLHGYAESDAIYDNLSAG